MRSGLVATNDVHFLNEDDYEAHNCLCCISTGKKADDPDRMIYPHDVFLKSPAADAAAFPGFAAGLRQYAGNRTSDAMSKSTSKHARPAF